MTEPSQSLVLCAATSASIVERLSEILVPKGVEVRTCRDISDCCQSLSQGRCGLLVMELDGDVAYELRCLTEVKRHHSQVPVMAIVDHGNIPVAVQALKAGATDCLDQPLTTERLQSAVEELLDRTDGSYCNSIGVLTAMELTVLQHILQGRTNRRIAGILCRSVRTIEVHRRAIMRKLRASNVVELIRRATSLGLTPPSTVPARSDLAHTVGTCKSVALPGECIYSGPAETTGNNCGKADSHSGCA